MQSLGWTWAEVDEQMDIPRLRELNEHWRLNPPVHVAVAAYLGFHKGGAQAPVRSGSSAASAGPQPDPTGSLLDALVDPEENSAPPPAQ